MKINIKVQIEKTLIFSILFLMWSRILDFESERKDKLQTVGMEKNTWNVMAKASESLSVF